LAGRRRAPAANAALRERIQTAMVLMRKFDTTEIRAAAEYFDRWGYVVFRNVIPQALSGSFWSRVEDAIAHNDNLTYTMYGNIYTGTDTPLDGKKLPRIIDIESHVSEARQLMLAPVVSRFLKHWYKGAAPTCLQTLTYKFSSEQGAHSDKKLVAPPHAHDYDRETLVASWFALEPSSVRNGALIIYPGSHRVPKPDLSWELEHDYAAYARALDTLCRENGCEPVTFEADQGDMLFWHGDLVHAGGAIAAPDAEPPTRKSLVCHYAALPKSTASRDPNFERVRYGGGSYFHKRAFLPPARETWLGRLLGGSRAG
jgi:ectoine hydroxylase-related dioxygenase (phytanoyl-CoA dioxygenase family)